MKPTQKDDQEKDKLTSLSDFLVVSPLGRGAGSLVYKIKSRKSGNEYALKSIHKDQSNPSYKSILQRLQSEIQIHQSLHHDHIVKLISHFDDSDNNYILLEYCESGDLFGYLQKKKKISEQEVKRLGLQFAKGLKEIHDKNIIHRDLKLGNILLTKDYNLKICDFGLSTKITPNQQITTLCGTPNYISPEMIKHQPYNEKIDIWAFGCIIHHLATGFNPFEVFSSLFIEKRGQIMKKLLKSFTILNFRQKRMFPTVWMICYRIFFKKIQRKDSRFKK